MDKNQYAFTRQNFILLAIGVAIVVIGFILMCGPGSTEAAFNPDIFSVRRIKVAPTVCLLGFLFMIVAILYQPRKARENQPKEEGKDE